MEGTAMHDRVRALFDLTGTVALVTGASSGLGRRMAETLAATGAAVVLNGRRRDALDQTARAIRTAGGRAEVAVADLADRTQIASLAEAAAAPFGPPDILVNAAGVNRRQPVAAVTFEAWDETHAVNLTAPFFLARALVPAMAARGWGRIINIASLQSVRAFEDGIAYGAAKGGVAQLTRAMAEAWSRSGVTCNAIAPGFFPTPLTGPVFDDPETSARLAAQTAIGRNGRLEDLDGITVFLAARASDYVTGQVIFVDGGFTAK
jgi:gluconate 5-dehydrogenase